MEYETIEPFGDYWLIQQQAVLCAAVTNALRGKTGKRYTAADFLPKPRRRRASLSPKDLMTKFSAFVFQHNATRRK